MVRLLRRAKLAHVLVAVKTAFGHMPQAATT
jgi:hypothetical protein